MVLVCHVISQDHVTKGSSNMGRCPSRLSHRYCGSGYISIVVWLVISQDQVIIWSCDLIDRSHSR